MCQALEGLHLRGFRHLFHELFAQNCNHHIELHKMASVIGVAGDGEK